MNKYSDLKICWFPDKLAALRRRATTAPIYVRFKPTNRCNHGCEWCVYNGEYSGMHTKMSKRDEMPTAKACELMREMAFAGVKAITFSGGGEPLLHPGIVEIISAANGAGMEYSIITNGQLLTGPQAEILRDAAWVRVSADYITAEDFSEHRWRGGEFYKTILRNISSFALAKKQTCDLDLNFIVTGYNWDRLQDAVAVFADAGIERIRFSPVWTKNGGTPPWFHQTKDRIGTMIELWRGRMKIEHSFRENAHRTVRPFGRCYFCEIVPVIGADLKLYPCHNMAYEIPIASLDGKSFTDVWFSESVRRWFDQFCPSMECTGQCANEQKNLNLQQLIDAYGDPFV